MALETTAFYILSAIMLAAALGVVGARNPVHSVLFLILAFFNAAGLFVLAGAELLAMLLLVVYVGAVAVLFLFVVMMLDVDFEQLRAGFSNYLPVAVLVAVGLLIELVLVGLTWKKAGIAPDSLAQPLPRDIATNAEALGHVLYDDYVLLFQASGFILFVAMVGAILLTLRQRANVRRQSVSQQVGRKREASVAMLDVKSGQGID
jgi:NADH-quinone oxidoreductase subunit J